MHKFFDAEALRKRRRSLDLTQEALARSIGKAPLAVFNWEHGIHEPSLHVVVLMAHVLDVPVTDLLVPDYAVVAQTTVSQFVSKAFAGLSDGHEHGSARGTLSAVAQ